MCKSFHLMVSTAKQRKRSHSKLLLRLKHYKGPAEACLASLPWGHVIFVLNEMSSVKKKKKRKRCIIHTTKLNAELLLWWLHMFVSYQHEELARRDGASFSCSEESGNFLVATFLSPVAPMACRTGPRLTGNLCWKPSWATRMLLVHSPWHSATTGRCRVSGSSPELSNSNHRWGIAIFKAFNFVKWELN